MMEKAYKLFKRFHRREPASGEIMLLEFPKDAIDVLQMGAVYGIIYKTKEEPKPFLHKFNKHNRPLLFASSDGKQLYILKGGYRLTERGIVG